MRRILYVSDSAKEQIADQLDDILDKTALDLEKFAKENNLSFEQDDMSNCYLTTLKDKDAWVFEEVGAMR